MTGVAAKFLLRLPTGLHQQLQAGAREHGVSLNQWIVALLAGAIGFTLNPQDDA